ncbi:MAG: hypothetical protein K2N94_14800, partial [Lachnospiraceae bacterium]|nr:hypothetical protein [Lachnospiraceae bacterium]
MKLYHFSIIFSIIFLAVINLVSWKEKCADELEKEKRILEKSVERAVDVAAGQLAVYCDGMLRLDREQVLESFFNTLYAGIGVLEYESLRQQAADGLVFFLIAAEGTIELWERQDGIEEKQGQNGWETLVLPAGTAGEEGVKILEQVLNEAAGRYG